jgi:hypothetical protein
MACSTMEVTVDYDRSADFARYRTFSFLPDRTFEDPTLRGVFEDAITQTLEAKGLRRITPGGAADLWIAIRGSVDRRTRIEAATYGYGLHSTTAGGAAVDRIPVSDVPVGTVVVDLVDAARNALVWQGIAADTLLPSPTPSDRERNVGHAMRKLLAGFPPKTR